MAVVNSGHDGDFSAGLGQVHLSGPGSGKDASADKGVVASEAFNASGQDDAADHNASVK